MKYFYYIFSLYFLVLSFLPCNDSEHTIVRSLYQTEYVTKNDHQQENHSHCNDFCSPFCTCACCGMTLNLQATFNYTAPFEFIPIPIVSENFSYQSPNSLQYLQGVFQPPKIG